jgi:hypothetical protein
MSLLLPRLLPDETLYSIGVRIHRLSGNAQPATTSQRLFGSKSALFNTLAPRHLARFERSTGALYGTAPELLESVTLAPFFLAFRSDRERDSARSAATAGSKLRYLRALGLPRSGGAGFMSLSHCVACTANDVDCVGARYWRRTHQLPGVLVCHDHGEPLVEVRQQSNGWRESRDLKLPADRGSKQRVVLSTTNEESMTVLRDLSAIQQAMLHGKLAAPFTAEVLQHTYRQGLRDHGLLTSAGHVRVRAYLNALQSRYRAISGTAVYGPYLGGSRVPTGLLRAERPKRGELSPIAHTLLIGLLWRSWEAFASAYAWQASLTVGHEDRDEDIEPGTCSVARLLSADERVSQPTW